MQYIATATSAQKAQKQRLPNTVLRSHRLLQNRHSPAHSAPDMLSSTATGHKHINTLCWMHAYLLPEGAHHCEEWALLYDTTCTASQPSDARCPALTNWLQVACPSHTGQVQCSNVHTEPCQITALSTMATLTPKATRQLHLKEKTKLQACRRYYAHTLPSRETCTPQPQLKATTTSHLPLADAEATAPANAAMPCCLAHAVYILSSESLQRIIQYYCIVCSFKSRPADVDDMHVTLFGVHECTSKMCWRQKTCQCS